MSNPPKSTPHSDIDGVHEDEKKNVDSATDAGEGTADLALAKEQSKGRPPYSDDQPDREDRSA